MDNTTPYKAEVSIMMKYLKYILILVVGLILFWIFFLSRSELVQKGQGPGETIYSIVDGENRISLTTFQTEHNRGILQLRSNSNLLLKQQIDLFSKILDRIWRDEEKEGFHTLVIGRLVNALGAKNKQMSLRLRSAALKSDLWDKKKGRPVLGELHTFIKDISNKNMIYPELKELFNKHGFTIKISSVEKVLVDSKDKLPYDCSTWFDMKYKE